MSSIEQDEFPLMYDRWNTGRLGRKAWSTIYDADSYGNSPQYNLRVERDTSRMYVRLV